MDLDKAFDEFHHLVETLEAGDLSLEESVLTHAKATKLSAEIQAELNKAERYVVQVIDQNGVVSDFGVVGERKGR